MENDKMRIVALMITVLIFLTCTATYAQDHDCLTANTKSIDLIDLISIYLPPPSAHFQAWKSGANYRSPINWKTEGIRWMKERKTFIREGQVVVTVSGKPICVLRRYWEPSIWRITLFGPRAGILGVEIETTVGSEGLALEAEMAKRQIVHKLYKCDTQGGGSTGERLYYIQANNKEPAWLYYEWSCGSGGCGYNLKLFLSREDADGIPNLTTSCSER
jgi:hypothetical protein